MKILPILIVIVLIVVMGVIVFYLESSGTGRETSGGWSSSDSDGSMAGQFGTEMELVYTDGSTSSLKILGFTFGGEDVDLINFRLSVRINGTVFNNCSVDLTEFYTSVELRDVDGLNIWDATVEYGNVSIVPLDGEWYYVYELVVAASDFNLEAKQYEFEFTPSGSVYVQGLPDGIRYKGELPSSRWIRFTVDEEKWIDIGFIDEPI